MYHALNLKYVDETISRYTLDFIKSDEDPTNIFEGLHEETDNKNYMSYELNDDDAVIKSLYPKREHETLESRGYTFVTYSNSKVTNYLVYDDTSDEVKKTMTEGDYQMLKKAMMSNYIKNI